MIDQERCLDCKELHKNCKCKDWEDNKIKLFDGTEILPIVKNGNKLYIDAEENCSEAWQYIGEDLIGMDNETIKDYAEEIFLALMERYNLKEAYPITNDLYERIYDTLIDAN